MYLYMLTSKTYKNEFIAKLGCTQCPYSRLQNFLTGYPPGNEVYFEGIWETTATTQEELFDLEERLHYEFHRYRLRRERPGDSEWFNFTSLEIYNQVIDFLNKQTWINHKVELPLKPIAKYLNKNYHTNINYVSDNNKRIQNLNKLQKPVIDDIRKFLELNNKAGVIIAPCGAGKTRMATMAIQNIDRVIICCPSTQIQLQWKNTLQKDCILIGSTGTTDEKLIGDIFSQNKYCIITTYMSSHLLYNYINQNTQLLILDEAHHLSGIVSDENEGEGRTRRLMMKAYELEIKRLSLTFTPRFVESEDNHISMDDANIFGPIISELKLRDMINNGVLPDYRIWTLRDVGQKAQGIYAKAQAIEQAWNAEEIYRGEERYILNHLIIFASCLDEVEKLETYFKSKTDSLILSVKGGDDVNDVIRRFNETPRAILINCLVLGEGVDIPIVIRYVLHILKNQGVK